ncbi:MAG: ABC transporter permease [Dermatophilaceae bacterium]
MSAVLAIALKDLRQRLRDRSAIVLGFIAPLAVAWLISMAFGSVGSFHANVAVVDLDGGPVATGFTSFLHSPDLADLLTVKSVASEADARAKVAKGDLGAAFVIPKGFSDAVTSGKGLPITVLSSVDSSIAGQVSRSLAQSFTAQIEAVQLSVEAAVRAGAPAATVGELAAEAATVRLPEQTVAQPSGTKALSAIGYYAPAMGIFFMFFAIGFGARGFFLERTGGTLDRLAAAPIGPGTILIGKSLATFVYGTASLGTVAVVTSLVFHADWGPPLAVFALIVALALTLVGMTALVITAARTARQSEGFASMLTFGLVLLGGNFIFIGDAPQLVRTLALLTPNGWALRAFTDFSGGADWTAVVTPLMAILAFALGTGVVAFALRRRVVNL